MELRWRWAGEQPGEAINGTEVQSSPAEGLEPIKAQNTTEGEGDYSAIPLQRAVKKWTAGGCVERHTVPLREKLPEKVKGKAGTEKRLGCLTLATGRKKRENSDNSGCLYHTTMRVEGRRNYLYQDGLAGA